MPFSDVTTDSITLPSDAVSTDPRIVIATDDPLSAGINDAAISFYWDENRGFVAGVDRAGDGPSALGQWRLYGLVTGFGLSQFINATYDPTDGGRDNISIRGGSRDPRAARVSVTGPNVDLGGTAPSDEAGRDVRIFGRSIPRGLLAVGGFDGVSGIGAVETVAVTVAYASATSTARRYRPEFIGRAFSTVAGDRARVRIRRTDTAGAVELDAGEVTFGAANIPVPIMAWTYVVGSGAIGDAFALTLQRTAGTGTIAYAPQDSGLMDIGPTSV